MITRIGIQILGWLLLALLAIGESKAQQVNMYWQVGTGLTQWQPVSAANPLPVNATVSASVTGFPGTTQTTGTPISVTTGGVTGTLPSGAVVVASNVGTTNAAYCKLGASATTSDQYIAPGSWFGFTVGSNTQLTCITSSSTTTVNMVGGAGLPTGAGGGGGSSGSNTSVSATGAAVPATATYVGINVGGNLTGWNGAVTNAGTFATQSAITAASGSISSGAVSSGAFASGSVASGAFASGSIASGAIAAGAQVDLLTMRGTKNAGTAAANSMLAGGVYNSTPLTLTDTQQASLQFDANGYLKVNTAAGAAAGGTSSNFGSAFPTPGTAVGFSDGTNMVAAKVGAVANVAAATNMLNVLPACNYNATPLTVTDTRYQSVQCDVNGFMKVNVTNANANGQATMANSSPVVIASNQTANALWGHGVTGSAVPANATYMGVNVGGNLTGFAPGTAGTASTQVVTVQGIASMTKLLVTPDANSAVNVAQINGVTPLMGAGNTGTGSPRVTVSTDQAALATWGHVATGAAPPSGSTAISFRGAGATGGQQAIPIACDNHVFKHITSATDTVAVQGVASQTIYICAWRSRAAGVATWYLENTASTNNNCSSTLTQLTGVATEAANTGETWGGAFWSGLKNTSGNGLCINSTGTGGVDIDIWYTQF